MLCQEDTLSILWEGRFRPLAGFSVCWWLSTRAHCNSLNEGFIINGQRSLRAACGKGLMGISALNRLTAPGQALLLLSFRIFATSKLDLRGAVISPRSHSCRWQ